jgi:hypothetical protein
MMFCRATFWFTSLIASLTILSLIGNAVSEPTLESKIGGLYQIGLAVFDGQVLSMPAAMTFDRKNRQFAIKDNRDKVLLSGSYEERVRGHRASFETHGELDFIVASTGGSLPPFKKSGEMARAVYSAIDDELVGIVVAPPGSPRPEVGILYRRRLPSNAPGLLYLSIYQKAK